MASLRVVQTIAGTRLDHGGTSRSVPALCDALVDLGVDNHLLTARPVDQRIPCRFPRDCTRVHLVPESAIARQYGIGRKFSKVLQELTIDRSNTVVHDHAVWLPSNHAVAAYCQRNKILRVVSPRGMLGKWALENGWWKKRIAWMLYQRSDLAMADAFHATSDQEAEEIRALGFKQPIAIVANGVDLPEAMPVRKNRDCKRALFLSRIHPKKGLPLLVQAWKLVDPKGWQLLIAGPDENGHQSEIESLVDELGLGCQIQFTGAVDDSAKWQSYVDADLFVLPSHNENFGIVIAEAMASGTPVLTTTSTPWSVLRDERIGWWVDPTVEAIASGLRDAISKTDSERVDMGIRASRYLRQSYSWSSSAMKLVEFYSALKDSIPKV